MTKHFTLPRQKALDSNADPVSGAKLYFFEAQTTTPLTVYTTKELDTAHGVFVAADGDGIFPPIYPPYGAYDVLMTDGTDAGNDYTAETTLYAKTTVQGDTDLTTLQNSTAFSKTEAETVAIDTTIVAADWGKSFDVNPTSATVTMTLPSAAASGVGNGFEVGFKHIGTANAILVETVNAETIDGLTGLCITRQQGSITLRSDGSNWKAKSDINHDGVNHYIVADKTLTAPPASPSVGDNYIMPSGTLTGLWANYSENDLVKYYGSGVYEAIIKETGDRAYIVDEDLDTRWSGSAWTELSNITAPQTSTLKRALFTHEEDSGDDGGEGVATTWTARPIDTEKHNNITGCSLLSNQITLPIGTYLILATDTQRRAKVYTRFKSTTTTKEVRSVANNNLTQTSNHYTSSTPVIMGVIELDAEEIFELQYYRDIQNNEGQGYRQNVEPEIFASIEIIDLESIQGPQGTAGAQGAPGADGLAGLNYLIDTDSTTMSDPGDGLVRFNNATLASVTAIALDDTTGDSGNPDISAYISTWDDSTSTIKGFLRVFKSGTGEAENFAIFTVSAVSSDSGWKQLTVSHIVSNGTFDDDDEVKVFFVPNGDKGDTGTTGAVGIQNRGAWSGITTFVSNDVTTHNGSTYICTAGHTNQEPPNASYWDVLAAKGADGAGSGDTVGPGSSTDNAVARFDSTTGKLLQNSGVIIDDSNNITGVGTVDGRNVATDGAKLDGIASGATNTTTEIIQDAAGVMFTGNTETRITVTYQDVDGTIDLVVDSDLANYSNATSAFLTSVDVGNISVTSEAQGDVLYRGSSGWQRLAAGTSGQFLKTQGGASDPIWSTIAGGGDLLASNNLSDVSSAATARANLDVPSIADFFEHELRIVDLEGDALGTSNRIADNYDDETDVDTATSTNESYSSGNDSYTPTVSSTLITPGGLTDLTDFNDPSEAFDGTTSEANASSAVSNSAATAYIGKTLGTAAAIDKVVFYGTTDSGTTAGGSQDITFNLRGKTGAAPSDFSADGDLLASETETDPNSITIENVNDRVTQYDHWWVYLTRSGSNSTFHCAEVQAYENDVSDMTLVSDAFVATSAPSSARLLVKAKYTAGITINTDLIGSISRDDGTTYTAGTLVAHTTYSDGTILYDTGLVDISGQPSDTDMRYKIFTTTNKEIEVTAAILQWS